MNEEKKKPVFRQRIFRDMDFDKIDYDKCAQFVIGCVFDRSGVDDIRQCRRYYGDDKMREVLLTDQLKTFYATNLSR